MISFTEKGAELEREISILLLQKGYAVKMVAAGRKGQDSEIEVLQEPLREWTKRQMEEADGIIFIGAVGIAVRSIGPFIKSKVTDPAVLVIDETGRFVIPILAGHIGGANALAEKIAKWMKMIPVITTATDLQQKFAIDLFAVKNNLHIMRMDYAKEISATILQNQKIGIWSEFPVKGELPENLCWEEMHTYGIYLSLENTEKIICHKTLMLIPRIITIGIGCRKGKRAEEIEEAVKAILVEKKISPYAIEKVASVDLKKEEHGLLAFCQKWNIPFETYSAEQLEMLPGTYHESDYVKKIAGVGSVCERAAVMGSDRGELLVHKIVQNGVTVSMAKKKYEIVF